MGTTLGRATTLGRRARLLTLTSALVLAGLLAGSPAARAAGAFMKASPNPVTLPLGNATPRPLVLGATSVVGSNHLFHMEQDRAICGLNTAGRANPMANLAAGQIPVGWVDSHKGDCNSWDTAWFYRAGVAFDWSQVNAYIKAQGFKGAVLHWDILQGTEESFGIQFPGDGGQCVGQVQENTENVGGYSPWPPVLPGGRNPFGAPQKDAAGGWSLGVAPLENLSAGLIPAFTHLVFIGTDESSKGQDNNRCVAVLGNFTLTVTPDH
jgi:hypothetical protein